MSKETGTPAQANHAGSAVKPRSPRRRKPPSPRDTLPPDIPEVAPATATKPETAADLLPEHIRRMLEAAYTWPAAREPAQRSDLHLDADFDNPAGRQLKILAGRSGDPKHHAEH